MEKNIEIGILLDLYGNLLTKKQKIFLDDYYNNDLSLAEIAENNGITRQAVRDVLQNGETNLYNYEDKLSLMKKEKKHQKDINKLIKKIEKQEEKGPSKEVTDILNKIKEDIKKL